MVMLAVLLPLHSFSIGEEPATLLADSGVYSEAIEMEASSIYAAMQLDECGLSFDAFYLAMKAKQGVRNQLSKHGLISIADFSQSSNQQRLYILDLEKRELLFQTYVAHGRNSGEEFAKKFSNLPGSYQSSPGCYITLETYVGEHGISLRMEGKDKGINHAAFARAIVMHGADYVSEDFIRTHGRLGRSLGCPAISNELAEPIIRTITGGSCFFIYTADPAFHHASALLR